MRQKKPLPPGFAEQYFQFFFNAILVGAALLYSFLNPYYRTGVVNDDAVFILGARNLWNRSLVPSFVIRPDYPLPGLPLLLAPFIKFVQPYWTRLEWVLIVMTLILIYTVGRWVRHYLSPGETLSVAFLLAFNPLIARFSGIVMPSIPYTLVVVLSFLLWGELLESWDPTKALALGVLLGWGCLIRPEGFLLLLSVASVMALTREGRASLPQVLIPIPFCALIFYFWCRWFPAPTTAYGGDLLALAAYWSHDFLPGLSFVHNLLQNTFLNSLITLRFSSSPLEVVCMLGLLAVSFAGISLGARELWNVQKSQRPVFVGVGLFSASYFLVHLFWHVAAPRYAIPLLPIFILFLVRGFNVALAKQPQRHLWAALVLAGLFFSYVYKSVHAIYESHGISDPQKSPPWHSLTWLREHTTPQDRIMSEIAPSIELYADRSTYPGVSAGNIDNFLQQLTSRDVTYILDRNVTFLAQGVGATDDPNKYWGLTRFRLASYPQIFEVVFEDPKEQTRIYHVVGSAAFTKAYELVKKAYQQYQDGQMDQAYGTAQASLSIFPRMGSAMHLLAVISWRRNEFAGAEQFFLKTIQLMPTSTKAMINLATLYHQTGHEERSRATVEQAFTVSATRGEQEKFSTRMKEVYRQWALHHGLILLDMP